MSEHQSTFCELLLIKSELVHETNITISLKLSKTYPNCNNFVFIFDGGSVFDPLMGIYDGKNSQDIFSSTFDKLFILFYNNPNSDDILIQFSANKCPTGCSNHGSCVFNECICDSDYSGFDCSIQRPCRIGSCNSLLKNTERFHVKLSSKSDGFLARAAHTASYIKSVDALYVFGGYNYNTILSNLQIYNFSINKWTDYEEESNFQNKNKTVKLKHSKKFQENQTENVTYFSKPKARYHHASCSLFDGFVIFGGKLNNGFIANDLWLFNVTTKQWSLRAIDSKINPPEIMMHSLLCLDNGTILLFGGIEQFSKYNWDLFSITLHETIALEQWSVIKAKNKVHRNIGIFGAACVYYNKTNSLIVIGGYNTKGVSNRKIYSFQLNFYVWSEIIYKPNKLYLNFDFKGIVFHTANIIGDYLIVYGGYFFDKNVILSPPIFLLYNLECNIWLSNDIIENFTSYHNLNVMNHASAVRSDNMLLIVGGMISEIINDFHAFTFPDLFLNSSKKDTIKEICSLYKTYKSCISNFKCGWCTSDEKCYEKISENNCSTKLTSMKCYSICETLNNCHSCMAYGNILSKDNKNLCTWCSANGNCVSNDNYYKKCAYHELSEMTNISKISECKQSQKKGLTLIEYNYPVDYSQPDKVMIINSTKAEIDLRKLYYDEIIKLMGQKIIIKILGTIFLPITTPGIKYIQACSDYRFILRLINERNNSHAEEFINEFSNYSPISSKICTLPINIRFGNESLNIEIESEIIIDNNMHLNPFTIELTHSAYRNRYQGQILDLNYLKPYSKGDCYLYQNCLQCLADSQCAWCSLNNQCFFRTDDESYFCKNDNSINNIWEYFIIEAKFCELCSHFYTCQNCVLTNKCEWKTIEKRCQRKTINASNISIRYTFQCPLSCEKIHQRVLCESNVLCKWFEITQQCLYFRRNMFQCNAEIITLSVENFMSSSHLPMLPFHNIINSPNCYQHENCSTCIQNLGCGWCHDNTSPLYGECVQGEYTHSYVSCDITLNRSNVTWYFNECPIVDKCLLNIIDCHPEAICINVNSSYVCQCKTGFYGNGIDYCMRTCNDTCKNGICSGYPNYECICELGWTGSDCSIDCGCNFHSTCTQGVGICDLCQDLTTGKFCDKCSIGTYRSFIKSNNSNNKLYGCKYCMCDGHGDIENGICDPETGQCFCSGNTEGFHCENCQNDFIGNPISGYSCYYKCKPKAILNSLDIRGFGFSLADPENYGNECLWIIQPEINSIKNKSFTIRVSIKSHQTPTMQCDNILYFYDGYIDFFNNFHNNSLIGFLCSNNRFHNVQFVSETGILIIYYRYRGLKDRFIATYDIIDNSYMDCDSENGCIITQLSCENNCSNIGYCNTEYGTCICPSSRTGSDCSRSKSDYGIVISEIFNSTKLHRKHNNLRKILPRFGHSLTSDNYENLWLFGGYSLSKGPLNDLMYFDTENYTWVAIDFLEIDGKQPKGRYFHASEISLDDDLLFVYGGLGIFDSSPKIRTLDDFWLFDLKTYRWIEIKLKERPPSLAGHSLTYCQKFNSQFLMLIGGISSRTGFMRHVWQYDIKNKIWTQVETHGSIPQGIFSHSTVFRLKHLYISGGYELESNGIRNPNNIYLFNIETYHWIKLNQESIFLNTKFNTYNFRSTVATNDYFLTYSPHTNEIRKGHILIFLFKCQQIIPSISKYNSEVDKLPYDLYIQAMTINSEKNRIYIFGGSITTLEMKLYRIELPNDFCYLFSEKKYQCLQIPGCSFCSMKFNNSLIDNYCYSNQKSSLDYCNEKQQYSNNNHNDRSCDENFEMNKNCTELDNCATCLLNKNCQWCDTCSGYCIPLKKSCLIRASNSIKSIFNCPRKKCLASNCYQCNLQKGCTWKENFNMLEIHDCMEISKNIKLQTVDKCVEKNILNSLLLKNTGSDICYENDCSTYINCESCVKTSQCFWSLRLNSCLSYHMQPLYCAGGLCGLSLMGNNDVKNCPLSCHLMEKCSDCLKISHCGWCANHQVAHEGFCIEGSINKPATDTCEIHFKKRFTINLQITSNFTWNFMTCPLENECINSHHNCSKKSEVCVDLDDGFLCQCSPGYNRINKNCVPNCDNSCIHGNCIEPNICQCHFGYTGERCQFRCNCNGNSDCPSSDQLDVCIKCHNNTSGNQCQYCQPGYIRVLDRSLRCITCNEYCNGHSTTCEDHDYVSVEEIISHNMNYDIKCTNCLNNTSGDRCETCVPGTFRGSLNLRNACTPCLCQGHGDRCNPVTGGDCNCKNNTENKMLISHLVNNLPFWVLQCGKCKDTYYGEPFEGHQCYKQMIPYIKMCFDNKFLDECQKHKTPLKPGEVSFFNIQPRFINMDVRITIDVTIGTLNVYLSTLDLFVVTPNSSIGSYNIDIDKNIAKLYFGNENIERSDIIQESNANELINYFKLKRNMSCFIVNNLRGRLVIILPMDLINFSYTKFFIILQAVPYVTEAASGIIYFSQDPNNIDINIFITSFISFFSLVFAITILIRKIRQISHSRTAARIQVIQMRQLSKRPYASITLKINNDDTSSNIVTPVAVEPTENMKAAVINCLLSLPSEMELNIPDNDYATKVVLGSSLICIASDTSVKQLLNKYEINN